MPTMPTMSAKMCRGAAALRQSSTLLRASAPHTPMPPPSAARWGRFRYISIPPGPPPPRPGRRMTPGRVAGLLAVFVLSGAAVYSYPILTAKREPVTPPVVDIVIEERRRPQSAEEDERDLISSQHAQVRASWEHPGVWAWGSNAGRVVAPGSNDAVVKVPRRIPHFDGLLLRDLKLDRDFGAAVDESGDLLLWGTAFSKEDPAPKVTLRGKDLVKLAISRDRVLALSSGGTVYSVPVSSADQASGAKPSESSWIPLWSRVSPVSYRTLQPRGLGWGEKVVDVSSGLDHCLLRTSRGRVYSAAASTVDFPSKGQLGIPGLTWATKPAGPFDQPHEVATLRGFAIEQIAAGDAHSLALDAGGRVFAFGDNSVGQLGFPADPDVPFVDVPSLLPLDKLYAGTRLVPRVASIAAGGGNSYFGVLATRVAPPPPPAGSSRAKKPYSEAAGGDDDVGGVVADVWACGQGIYGGLGNGKWTHISAGPSKIKSLSGLFEYDEARRALAPIRLARLSAGGTHAAAVMGTATNVAAADTNWGADVLWWGGNESYQLGTGKRNNASEPTYIAPLGGAGKERTSGGRNRDRDRDQDKRMQITPRKTVRLGEGGNSRRASVEQRVECGRLVSAVYSGT